MATGRQCPTCADEFLPVDQQDRAIPPVDEAQFWDVAPLGHLGDLDHSLGESLIQREVERRPRCGMHQREDREVAKLLGCSDGENIEC